MNGRETNEQRALVPQCPDCGAAPGMRCLQHLSSEVYRLVHRRRGQAAGLNSAEILRLDFGDMDQILQGSSAEGPGDVAQIVQAGRADDLALALTALGVALDLAQGAGADVRAVARLRRIYQRLLPQTYPTAT